MVTVVAGIPDVATDVDPPAELHPVVCLQAAFVAIVDCPVAEWEPEIARREIHHGVVRNGHARRLSRRAVVMLGTECPGHSYPRLARWSLSVWFGCSATALSAPASPSSHPTLQLTSETSRSCETHPTICLSPAHGRALRRWLRRQPGSRVDAARARCPESLLTSTRQSALLAPCGTARSPCRPPASPQSACGVRRRGTG